MSRPTKARRDYREFATGVLDRSESTIIGALRVFFRDFLDREVMDAFEMPSKSAKPTDVPSKEELQTFMRLWTIQSTALFIDETATSTVAAFISVVRGSHLTGRTMSKY